eukprot:TRINITY_DN10693_c0_g1_i2.p1 TRINITY_DN10693_c0_g1~~TRINITY_DN10693_c0_g1_i2.p1  ORF type:complete len:205 (+),score=66.39 TRINITY_DN10693_c0_g1_i2:173-787(+)
MDPTLDPQVLAISGPLARRPAALDPNQRIVSAFVAVNPMGYQDLAAADELVGAIMHEMAHSLGLGTNWPTLGGCGDVAACLQAIADDPAAQVPYAAGVDGVCQADVQYQLSNPGEELLLETTEKFEGSNCGHWLETQLYGEMLSTRAITLNPGKELAPAAHGKVRLHLTSVTVGALEDLGYQVNYDSPWIEPFDSIFMRQRQLL